MRFECYRNLNKRCWSQRARGKVLQHADRLVIAGCEFVSQPAGRERVRREGRKNVHAFVRSNTELRRLPAGVSRKANMVKLYYNPYEVEGFVVFDDVMKKAIEKPRIVTRAHVVLLDRDGSIWAHRPEFS